MRTTADLIKELTKESPKFIYLNLVVGFEDECKFVEARESEPLKKLNTLVKAGGEPIGFVGLLKAAMQGSKLTIRVMARPVREYESDPKIKRVLDKVSSAFADQMRAQGAKIDQEDPGMS